METSRRNLTKLTWEQLWGQEAAQSVRPFKLFITFENSNAVKLTKKAAKLAKKQALTDELKIFRLLKLTKPEDPSVMRWENYSLQDAHPGFVIYRMLGY